MCPGLMSSSGGRGFQCHLPASQAEWTAGPRGTCAEYTEVSDTHTGPHMVNQEHSQPIILYVFKNCDCLPVFVQLLEASIRPDTSLVSVMTVNNEIGVKQPITEIGNHSITPSCIYQKAHL